MQINITLQSTQKPCITTTFVWHKLNPIVYISLDDEEDWQFHSDDESNAKDAFVVSLGQLLEKFPELNNIPLMKLNSAIVKSNITQLWEIDEQYGN